MTMFDSGACDWLVLPLLLPTPTTKFSLDHKGRSHKRDRKKWKRSDSSDSDSAKLITPLTTPIFDFRFSIFTIGHKLSYDSDYESDSFASENQPSTLDSMNNGRCHHWHIFSKIFSSGNVYN